MNDNPSCKKCGDVMHWKDCWNCCDGYVGHDCGEDCCMCAEPEDNVICDICGGKAGYWICHTCSKEGD